MSICVRRPAKVAALAVLLSASAGHAMAADLTVDDRALKTSGKWSKVSQQSAFEKTLLKSAKKGATLTASTAATSGGSVTFQFGKARGTATITVGGKKRAIVKTSAKKKAFKTVKFSGSGSVKITVSKQGGGVYVDAVTLTGLGTTPVSSSGTTSPSSSSASSGNTSSGNTSSGNTSASSSGSINFGELTQLNVAADGTASDGNDVTQAAVSPNGQYVAFWSKATNLVPGVADGFAHLYLRTIASSAIRVLDQSQDGALSNDSSSSSGARGLAWKPDSTEVLFTSSATNLVDVGTLRAPFLLSKSIVDDSVGVIAERASIDIAWSPDGSKIAYGSYGDYCFSAADSPCTNTAVSDSKLYVWDLTNDRRAPISATATGGQPQVNSAPNGSTHPVWSPDSKKVAFQSDSRQLVDGDTNVASDLFVKDLTNLWTGGALPITRVSTTASGAQANGMSEWPAWSPDGTQLAFDSKADNLVVGDNNSGADVFVKNLATGALNAVSATTAGEFKLFEHRLPKWSPDGTRIAFETDSVDLVPGVLDANERADIVVRTLDGGAIALVSARPDGVQGNGASTLWNLPGSSGGWLPDGHSLVFVSRSTNFATDGNGWEQDLFIKRGL
ncbi:MAG: hypothetical protein QM679_04160 [Patulibacter sp.]